MKNVCGLLAGLILLAQPTPASSQVHIGVIGGVSLAKTAIEPDVSAFSFSNRTGSALGGVLRFDLAGGAALQFEPMVIGKGTKVDVEGFGETVTVTSWYLEIPAMLTVEFGSSSVHPYIMAGPTLGYLLSANQKASFIPPEEEDVKPAASNFDFGLGLGGGVRIPAGSNTVFVEGRYVLGLTNTDADESAGDFTESIKNRGILLLAGFTFPF